MNQDEQNKEIKNSYYGTKLSFAAAKAFLAVTTFIAAFTASMHIVKGMTGYESVIAGIIGAMLITRFIDGTLDNDMNYLLEKQNAPTYKWAKMFFVALLSGGATWFSASIIADMGTNYVSSSEQTEMIEEAQADNDKAIARLAADIERKQGEILKLQERYSRDTAAVLSAMNGYHARYWRSGKWKAYYGKAKYPSLTASIDKMLEVDTVYRAKLATLSGDLEKLNAGYTNASSKDVAAVVTQVVADENGREEQKNANISTFIKILDPILLVVLLLIFFDLREMKKRDKITMDGVRIDFTKWAMDRLAKMKERALTTETKFDDALVDMLTMIVNIIASIFRLFSWIAGIISKVILLPTKWGGERRSPEPAKAFTSSPQTSSPQGVSPRLPIGFHHEWGVGEQRPVNAGELMQKLASEQAVNKGGENRAKPGATQVSGGERPAGEHMANGGGEQVVNTPGEQVVNGSGERIAVKVVNGEPTFPHYSEKNGELMFYTRNEVKRFESKYRSAVNKIKDWLKQNQNTAESEKVLAKKQQLQDKIDKHKYWLAGLEAIDRIKAKG